MKRSPLTPLFLVIFIDTFGYFLVLPIILRLFINIDSSILPPTTSLAARHWLYGITLSLSPLAFISLSPFIGHLSDTHGRKTVIGACLIASLLGFILPIIGIYTKHISLIMIGRFIAGAGTASQPVAQAAITDFSTGNKRAFNLSLIGLSMTLAMVLGPLSGGYLSDPHLVTWFDTTTPYWVGTLLAMINLFFLYTSFEDTRPIMPVTSKSKRGFSKLFNRPILCLLTVFMVMQLTWSAFYQSSFLFLGNEYHFSTDTISEFAAAAGLWMCLGLTVIFRAWITLMDTKKIAFISVSMVLVGFISLYLFNDQRGIWYCTAPIALFAGTAYPALLQVITEHTPAEHQGWMLGVASTLLGLAWMITGIYSVQLAKNSITLLVTLCCTLLSFALIVFLMLRQNHDSTA